MRILIFSFIFLQVASFTAVAQKKGLDRAAIDSWPKLESGEISDNGKFATYSVNSKKAGYNWVVIATDLSWKKEFDGIRDVTFTPDSRRVVFINRNDSLGLLDLGGNSVKYFPHVKSFKVISLEGKEWLGILYDKPEGDFVLHDLVTDVEKRYSNSNDCVFTNNGSILLLQVAGKGDSIMSQTTVWVNLKNNTVRQIDRNLSASDFIFDETMTKIGFLAEEKKNGRNIKVLKYYVIGMDSAMAIVEPSTKGMEGREIMGDISFSKEGDKIFFRTNKLDTSALSKIYYDSVDIEIRDYKDEILAPGIGLGSSWTVTHVNDPAKVIRLEQDTDFVNYRLWVDHNGNGKYALVEGKPTHQACAFKPNDQLRKNLYLVSTDDGSRKLIKGDAIVQAYFSLTGKYVIWYDREQGQWSTYRISDGVSKNITKMVPTAMKMYDDYPGGLSLGEGLAGWLENDKAVFIYDQYDIWQVDPDAIMVPINITSGWGRKNKVSFKYMDFVQRPFGDFDSKSPVPLHLGDTLILSAFNFVNKGNGFYSLVLGKINAVRKLIMGMDDYYFRLPYSLGIDGICVPEFPLKAKGAKAFIVQKMNSAEYPNLSFTTDFKEFVQLTNLGPQKDYNWYSTELIHFPLSNGIQSEGILYRPENFDSRKKYPIIFFYYEKNAAAVHSFIHPMLSGGVLNIPWFVSNGYIVFVPDIVYYKVGYPGECAYQTVSAAANFFCQFPWVNANRMGLQGHSFGGWETNYIVTKTRRFAAAASSSGFCDAISLNSQLSGRLRGYFEVYQGRLGVSFWESPELYIRNSPIFNADKVTTPLLILHNTNDPQVPFVQGSEWFNGLTHMQKKVWLLTYRDGHALTDEKNKNDYSIRLSQFFDHYLKGAPPPKWMTQDTHTRVGRNYSTLELDTSGKEP